MKKIGIIPLVLVICLALVGTSYAHWTKSLSIEGTVLTGTVDIEWSVHDVNDNEDVKDVAHAVIANTGLGENDPPPSPPGYLPGQDTLGLLITNAYPGYIATFVLDVHGCGSVPAHVYEIMLDVPETSKWLLVTYTHWGPMPCEDYPDEWDQLPVQLHFCDEMDLVVTVEVLQEVDGDILPQGETLDFSIAVYAEMFNCIEEQGECDDNEPPVVTITRPLGGEVWHIGDTEAIEWLATDPDHDDGLLSIDIYFSADDGVSYFPLPLVGGGEALGLPNTGEFGWEIPNDPRIISSTCKIKVVATDPCFDSGEDASPRFCPPPPDGAEFTEQGGFFTAETSSSFAVSDGG